MRNLASIITRPLFRSLASSFPGCKQCYYSLCGCLLTTTMFQHPRPVTASSTEASVLRPFFPLLRPRHLPLHPGPPRAWLSSPCPSHWLRLRYPQMLRMEMPSSLHWEYPPHSAWALTPPARVPALWIFSFPSQGSVPWSSVHSICECSSLSGLWLPMLGSHSRWTPSSPCSGSGTCSGLFLLGDPCVTFLASDFLLQVAPSHECPPHPT